MSSNPRPQCNARRKPCHAPKSASTRIKVSRAPSQVSIFLKLFDDTIVRLSFARWSSVLFTHSTRQPARDATSHSSVDPLARPVDILLFQCIAPSGHLFITILSLQKPSQKANCHREIRKCDCLSKNTNTVARKRPDNRKMSNCAVCVYGKEVSENEIEELN